MSHALRSGKGPGTHASGKCRECATSAMHGMKREALGPRPDSFPLAAQAAAADGENTFWGRSEINFEKWLVVIKFPLLHCTL